MPVLLVLAAAGCASMGWDKAAPMAARSCYADADCDDALGEVCRSAKGAGAVTGNSATTENAGVCVIRGSGTSDKVWLEIRPQESSVPPTQAGPFRLSDGQNRELLLPVPVSVDGFVRYDGPEPRTGVKKAKLRFSLAGGIPGRPLLFDTDTSDTDPVGAFRRRLPSGSFVVSVYPPDSQGEPAPPERWNGGTPVPIATDSTLVIAVSSPSDLIRLSGRVETEWNGVRTPAAGVAVRALDAVSGVTQAVAQPAVTAADGSYALWLPGRTSPTPEVRLEVGPAPGGRAFPVFSPAATFNVTRDMTADPIVVPGLSGAVPVSGWVYTPDQKAIEGAIVTFRTVAPTAFQYAVSVRTDRGGAYATSLFPGAYAAVAEPPDGSELPALPGFSARDAESVGLCPWKAPGAGRTLVVEHTEPGVEFLCDKPRQSITVHVVDHLGRPVTSVVAEAVRRPDAVLADEIREQAAAEEEDWFELRLSSGTWDLTLRPPPDSKLPFRKLRNLLVPEARGDRARPFETSIMVELDPPFELFGRVYSGSPQSPVAATLEAYATDAAGVPFLLGRGLADVDGSYSVVLPGARQ